MTYIGGTLYAPMGFSLETFKERLESLVQGILDVNEPCAIGMGTPTNGAVVLRIKSVALDDSVVKELGRALSTFYAGLDVTVEAVGTEKIGCRDNFTSRLAEATEQRETREDEATTARQQRIARDAEQQRLNSMTIEELWSRGYDDEARIREESEMSYSNEPDYYS